MASKDLIEKIFASFREQVAFMLVFTVKELQRIQAQESEAYYQLVEKVLEEGIKMGQQGKTTPQEARVVLQKLLQNHKVTGKRDRDLTFADLEGKLQEAFLKAGIPLGKKQTKSIVDSIRYPLDRPELSRDCTHANDSLVS